MTRSEANQQLVKKLTHIIEKYPNLRFSQLLSAFRFVEEDGDMWVDEFYVESEDILKRVILYET